MKKYFIFLLFFTPHTLYAQNILDQIVPPTLFAASTPLTQILNQLFYIGLIAAVILAVSMIVRGGIEYMSIDSATGKEGGKNKFKAAIGGLLLAFSAILILKTINPGLVRMDLVLSPLNKISSIVIETDIKNSVNRFQGLSNEQFQEIIASGKVPTDISPAAQKILAEAIASIDTLKTGTIDNTNGGRLACAAAVNKIVELATGQAVGGELSTAAMYDVLENSSRFQLVLGGVSSAQPGDIIISPTKGTNHGHVGIVASNGASSIISNSSWDAVVKQNFSASSWDDRYGSKKGLKTYIYRPL